MKAIPIKLINQEWVQVSVEEATHVELIFPLNIEVTIPTDPPYTYYPLRKRIIPIQLSGSRAETSNWSWNGDTERPTLKPSILTEFRYAGVPYRCHSFVNDGVVQFLSDCSHELVGQTVELVEVTEVL
ncbi:DUF6527 family protein [Sulfuricurvum sp.]|uniref:DUF6527 family protein n=1 Tax=Sulfuricurvum sp. TaxID=2025608 RepID=UPI003BB02D07